MPAACTSRFIELKTIKTRKFSLFPARVTEPQYAQNIQQEM